jgi:hypothetical protein
VKIRKMRDQVLKDKWLKALRSGKYRRGEGALCVSAPHGGHKKYCCLGVLGECTGQLKKGEFHGNDAFLQSKNGDRSFLVAASVQTALAGMNDDGTSFAEIADWIEEHL